ncbi:Ada metal-binding domain-containing protein [Gordonia sp. w5E2]|nr:MULTISPECIES: Ada metal-binding domain-containing protein [unclassified Gordonia (in: high G+C Gram-positive bacteria)]OBC08015.1 DNA-3-methyladenine glycosylase [Gordonia sp. 852002-50816_SCH5313054-a]OBC21212.1 DNA-3-methyladenine glycosylase [Gordonia sp. 852002-50816_SCH5313054-c]
MSTSPTTPDLDFDTFYRALSARDRRFDGQFFVTVHTTGIYCRPSCPARTPLPANVSFVPTAAAAQTRGFRACRRCAPDAVPGSPRWNANADLGARAMRLITDGVVERDGVDGLAAALGYSPRHLTRVLNDELGAGPLALARAHRATNARILIQRTTMPMADVAFAAGFSSVRQFNDTIREIFGLTPTRLRALRGNGATDPDAHAEGGVISLRLPYREPFDASWPATLLGAHAVDSMEEFTGDPAGDWTFARVLTLPHGYALVRISPGSGPKRHGNYLRVDLLHLDSRDLGAAVSRVRRLLDLDADAAAAEDVLRRDPRLAPLIDAGPGIRLPGSPDPAEALIRTMMGQQISVGAARHHVGALVSALGETTGWTDGPGRAFPTATAIAEQGRSVLRGPRARVDAIVAAASKIAENSVELHQGVAASELRARLLTLHGVGVWTADYVTMVVTGDPDTLLHHDLVVRHAANDLGIDLTVTQEWAPWRSYASMHLWRHRLGQQLGTVA